MRSPIWLRVLPLLGLSTALLASRSVAQSTLPLAAPATTVDRPATSPAPRVSHRAEISFANGLLTVQAHNTSLNQIIREIGRQTGMRITGSVAEDRVFGTYGPADPSHVLSALLDGTGSNVLIVANASDRPTELILTPRLGAPTPPNPDAAAENDADTDEDGAPVVPVRRGFPIRGNRAGPVQDFGVPPAPAAAAQQTGGNPAATGSSTTDQTIRFPPIGPGSTPATASTTPADSTDSTDGSNSVKTPQQIFDELQKLQQDNPK